MSRNAGAALAAIMTVTLLAGCGLRIPGVTPFKMEIQQGNYVTQEMVAQLRSGMAKEQVRQVLGTPLLADAFHGERWDYVYWREDEWGKREMRKLAVFFMDGKLVRLEGDIVAAREPPKEPKESVQ
ncbi:MAG TPA: outer membrane protein assembly factor BamE [Burkholderiales bacterium]|nr:outer membrane protein assembly factor BamE [Burkholderiales bacterium]